MTFYFGRPEITPIRSKTEPIPDYMLRPHYSDERFMRAVGGKTIFLAEGLVAVPDMSSVEIVEGVTYNYMDRLYGHYGSQKIEVAYDAAASSVGNTNTAAFYEAMLQRIHDNPALDLQHMIAGIDRSNWNHYLIYGIAPGAKPTR